MKIKSFIFLFSLVFFSFWAPSFANANYWCTTTLSDGSSISSCEPNDLKTLFPSTIMTCEEAGCVISDYAPDQFCTNWVPFTLPKMSTDEMATIKLENIYECWDDRVSFDNGNWNWICKNDVEYYHQQYNQDYTSTCEKNYSYIPFFAYAMRCCFTLNPTPTSTPTPTLTPTLPPPAECQVTTDPPSLDLLSGESSVSVADVTGLGSATINQMHFGVYENPPGTIIATVDPISDSDSPYFTRVSPVINDDATWVTGTTAVWATADLSDGRTCQSSGITDTDISISAVISAKVFNDDGDGVQETGEKGTAGAIVTLTQPNESQPAESRNINAGDSGSVAFLRIPGNYTLTVTVPSGYRILNSNSQVASIIINNLSRNMTYDFPVVPPPGSSSALTPQVCDWEGDNAGAYCITADGGPGTCDSLGNCSPGYSPSYSISGKLFLDNYEDTQSTGDDSYTNSVAVTVKKGEETFAVTPSGGTYTADNLPAGDYTIKFSGLPTEYRFTYPNTPDNSLQVQVGPTCEYPTTTSEASCRP